MTIFLSTPSARRATDALTDVFSRIKISIHALREEGDLFFLMGGSFLCLISIHALREEGDSFNKVHKTEMRYISIHALREEGDSRFLRGWQSRCISIHALREEGDASAVQGENQPKIFLSTPSARRATDIFPLPEAFVLNFYPRPPRGGRRSIPTALSCS